MRVLLLLFIMAFLWHWGFLSVSLKSSITASRCRSVGKGLVSVGWSVFYCFQRQKCTCSHPNWFSLLFWLFATPANKREKKKPSQGNTLSFQTSNKIVQDFSLCVCVSMWASLYTLFVFISSLSSMQSVLSNFLGFKTASSRLANQEAMRGMRGEATAPLVLRG